MLRASVSEHCRTVEVFSLFSRDISHGGTRSNLCCVVVPWLSVWCSVPGISFARARIIIVYLNLSVSWMHG